MQPVLGIVGTGRLGEAIAASLLREGWTSADRIVCTDVDEARVAEVTARLGVRGAPDALEAARQADLLLVAVKPQQVRELLAALSAVVEPRHTVLSVAAGITVGTLEALLPPGTAVVRVMPNTPILVGEAMSAITPGSHVAPERVEIVEDLLGQVGRVVRVPESAMDAVTAVSGSGPAYVFLLAEAMTEAGEAAGLDAAQARALVVQTVLGAARLLAEDDRDAADLRRMVTSPNGTTEAAIQVLEDAGFRQAFREAITAAMRRSRELSAG